MRQGTFLLVVALALAACLAGSVAPQAGAGGGTFGGTQTLYGATGNNVASNLYVIDPSSGGHTVVGPIGHALTGLAVDPTTGTMYGVTTPNDPTNPVSLVTVNRATGASTVVGPLGATIADIAFTSSGALYGWSESVDGLTTIDKSTGVATNVGAIGLGTAGDGESFSPSGVLYDMSRGSTGELWTVDTATGTQSVVGSLSGSPGGTVNAATFGCDGSTLYASVKASPNYLATVNTTTRIVTTIGPTTIAGTPDLDALTAYCSGSAKAHRSPGEYCTATPVNRADGTVGRYVDLVFDQQLNDPKYAGATPALYAQGYGSTCDLPSADYKDAGYKVDLTGSRTGQADAIYEYFTK
jgi:hypothetical protein